LVANKADEAKMFPSAADFAKLGFGNAFCISAANNLNKSILVEKILETLADSTGERPKEVEMKIAIVGKRNAGKSAFTNAIAGEERVIVSEIPGTTRDSIDIRFEKDGKTFVVIDTAGISKKSKLADSIEFYSFVRAEKSIRRADVVLLLIDAAEPLSQVDKKLASFIGEEYKPCILVVNKWDLAKEKATTDDYAEYIGKIFPQLNYAPIAFTTATESKNIQSVLDLACELYKQSATKISTANMNKAIEQISSQRIGGRSKTSQLPKIYYATQISTKPVTILLFVNNVDLFDENYKRFLIGKLRDILSFAEVPIRLFARPRRRELTARRLS
jgi:GTP-binding protein